MFREAICDLLEPTITHEDVALGDHGGSLCAPLDAAQGSHHQAVWKDIVDEGAAGLAGVAHLARCALILDHLLGTLCKRELISRVGGNPGSIPSVHAA